MNTTSIERRIDRLEKAKKTSVATVHIFCLVNQLWAVPRDFCECGTLQEAVQHVKDKYHSRHIIVGQMGYIMHRMTYKQLQRVRQLIDPAGWNEEYKYLPDVPKVPLKTKGFNDPLFKPFKKPIKPLQQVMKDNPDIKFELGPYDESKYWEDKKAANIK